MAIGLQEKDGIIIKSKSGFNYYHGRSDTGLRKIKTDPVGTNRRRLSINTLKIDDIVEIANNKISVRIHPNGNIDIEPSKANKE